MAWGTLPRDGAQEDAQREEMGSPRASTKRAEAAQPLPRETEALRTGEGRIERVLLTRQMDFPVEKSPAHSVFT